MYECLLCTCSCTSCPSIGGILRPILGQLPSFMPTGKSKFGSDTIVRMILQTWDSDAILAGFVFYCFNFAWTNSSWLRFAMLCRWIQDSRDQYAKVHLNAVNDEFKPYHCHTIMNCARACPKGLNPAKQIESIKKLLLQ
ncbi:succinate dehydrogenase ubiquinone iron-sulfur subunit [Musa troglodytarum]|uniref:Succinate dehydrogenase ubiquinone iron-sulfur subunit n=1 Tax=Musa troglodytarum TaxID=320322 RepID=A0A9E7EHV1_9LILI|nr:succinate dehydrogenase ubiquinone iron-sulfur subunit [Musa troglodytarum]